MPTTGTLHGTQRGQVEQVASTFAMAQGAAAGAVTAAALGIDAADLIEAIRDEALAAAFGTALI